MSRLNLYAQTLPRLLPKPRLPLACRRVVAETDAEDDESANGGDDIYSEDGKTLVSQQSREINLSPRLKPET